MTGFIFATYREAKPFLHHVNTWKISDEPFLCFEFSCYNMHERGIVLISGMGKEGAGLATQHLITKYHVSIVVNAGICAATIDKIKVGEVFRVEQIREENSESSQAQEDISVGEDKLLRIPNKLPLLHLPKARLITVETPVFEPERKKQIRKWGELIDMEGAAIAGVCAEYDIPCYLVKGVSDHADHNGKQAIQDNIESVSEKIAQELINALPQFSSAKGNLTKNIMRFIKIEHTIFSLPLLFAGAWLGNGRNYPALKVLFLLIMAAVGARIIGMAMNRILDRKIDALNPRTANRELPKGSLLLIHGYTVVVFGTGLYLVACYLLGGLCWRFWPVPFIPLMTYSLLKRFTNLCHFGIGLCLGLVPLGAYVATSQTIIFDSSILYLSLFTFCWMSGSDIVYALLDIDFDRNTGVHSLPATLGATRAQVVAGVLHIIAFASLIGILWTMKAGSVAWLLLLVASGSFVVMYVQQIPIHIRFFPISAVAGIAGALVPVFA
jgi:4-hydroxybenzoate polyprenyltransferase